MSARPPRDTDPPLVWAEHYVSLGWALSFFPPGTKGPRWDDWNTPGQWIDTPAKARAQWARTPSHGMGVIHAGSGTVALDIDAIAPTRRVFADFGIDLDAFLAPAPRIRGARTGRDKALFRAPAGEALATHKFAWRHPGHDRARDVTLFELRAGAVHDVLPPSVHPDGHRYAWRLAPWELGDALPPLPAALLDFWRAAPMHRARIAALAPWGAPPAPPALPAGPRPPRAAGTHDDVIGAFNRRVTVHELLEAHGYVRDGKRYLAPGSSTGIAGVVVLDDGRAYSHHGSDVLADGHAHDSFDLFTRFEHGGEVAAAVRAAAEILGIPPRASAPSAASRPLGRRSYLRLLLEAEREGHAA